jgi:hypothetical protein
MPRKHGSHIEVISAFVEDEEYPYEGSNVFFRDNVLYSYGFHFPLAIKGIDGMIIVNGDKTSVSTSKHQSILQRALYHKNNYSTTSFSALGRWIKNNPVHHFTQKNLVVLHYIPDEMKHKYYGLNQEGHIPPETMPLGATVTRDDEGNIISWHRPASILLNFKTEYALASMDENQYFVSVLPTDEKGIPNSVDEAFNMLKPDYVKEYEKEHGPVPRQGEWFFLDMKIPKDLARKKYYEMYPEYHLIGYNQGNSHIATRGCCTCEQNFVSGQIRHPQHKMLKLSTTKNIKIFRAIENTAVVSYSAAGNVD